MSIVFRRLIVSPWTIAALALVVRLAYLVQYTQSPFFLEPIWDAEDYHEIALALSRGTLLPELAFRPPLYPVVLGVVYMLFGSLPLLPRLLQVGLGVASCVLVKRIGDRLFGQVAGSIAGIASAFSGMMFYFDLELLPTSLVVFLYLLFMEELLRSAGGRGSPLRTGIWLGLGSLARPLLLPFYPVAVWWLHRETGSWKKVVRLTAGCVIPLGLSLTLHLLAGSGPVLVSAQGGVNFYIGNHRTADGITARFPGIGAGWDWETVRTWAEHRTQRPLNAAQIDRIFWSEGIKEIQADPSGWLKRLWRKARLFWSHTEISNNRDLYYHASRFAVFRWLFWLGFPVVLPIAMIGLMVGRRRSGVTLIGLLLVIYFLTVTLFFVNARFRHPLTPFLFVFAAGGIVQVVAMIRQWKTTGLKEWGILAVALLMGLVLPYSVRSGVDKYRWDYGLYTEGMVLERLGRTEQAEVFYKKALTTNPAAPFVNFNLAEMARNRGDPQAAADYYGKELTNQPYYAKAWNNLGVVLTDIGDENRALAAFEKAAEIQPGLDEAARNAARIWGLRGLREADKQNWKTARKCFNKASSLLPGDPLYRTLILESRVSLGDTTGVRQQLGNILGQHPSFEPAHDLLTNLESNSR